MNRSKLTALVGVHPVPMFLCSIRIFAIYAPDAAGLFWGVTITMEEDMVEGAITEVDTVEAGTTEVDTVAGDAE